MKLKELLSLIFTRFFVFGVALLMQLCWFLLGITALSQYNELFSMALGLHPVLPAESGLKPAVPAASPSKPSFSFKLPRQTLTRQPFGLGGHCSGIHIGPSWEETPRPPPPHCGALEAETPHCSPEGGPPCLQGTWNHPALRSAGRAWPCLLLHLQSVT